MSGEVKLALCVAAVLALGVTHYLAYDYGRADQRAAAATVESKGKDAVIGAVLARVDDNAKARANNEAKARKVSDVFEKEVARVLDYRAPVASVRLPALAFAGCSGAAGSPEAAGAGGPDAAAAGTVVFPEAVQQAVDRFTEGAGRLAKEADKATAVARGHQQFALENGFYVEPEGSK
jgi:hypothetical protein